MKENKVRVVFEAFMDKFQRDVKAAAKATLEIGDAGAKASDKVNFDESNESVNRLETSLNRLQGVLKAVTVGYVGKKLFDGAKENLEYFMEFEDGMKATHTLLPDMTEVAFGEMSKQVKQFAKDMKVLPENITPALYDAISAGVPDVEVFDFLEDAQIAARGGRTDLGTSVDFLTNVINAYGREVITAKEASDSMFVAMRNGKVSFDEMAGHMYSIVPVASAVELPFNNVAAAVGRLGAQGTPVAQATTQLGALIRELSSADSKAGEIFQKATDRTLRQFIVEGNNLQDIIMVMDAASKKLNVEATDLFGSKEAGSVVSSLTKGKEEFTQDLIDIQNSAGATAEAYEKLDGTLSATFDGIKAKIAVFKLDVGDNYLPEISEAANKVDESLERLDENGTLESLASSIAGAVITIINQFDNLLNNIDGIIEGIDNLASFIDNHLPGAITVVKGLAAAFLAVKAGMVIKDGIELFAGGLGILKGVIEMVTGAQWAWNASLLANPITWIVVLIGGLIVAIIMLSSKYESFTDFLLVSYEVIKIEFYGLVGAFAWGFDQIARWIDNLIGWIPGIGEATGWVAEQTGKALDGLNGKIDESIAKINELNNKKIKSPNQESTEPMTLEEEMAILRGHRKQPGKVKQPQIEKPDVVVPDNLADMLKKSGKGKKAKKPKKTKPKTIRDRINDIQDKHDPDIDLYESRADLAKAKEDDKGVKKNKMSVIEVLKRQAADMLKLQLSSKGQDVKVVEAARNKVLIKIQDILKDINDGVSKMVGDFNKPSDLRLLTEYQYKVDKSDNTLLKRLVYSPDISMYLTIADTGKKGVAQVKDEINHFTGAIFDDKNDLVTQFMRDVTRN